MKSLHDIILPITREIQAGNKTIEVSELWGASKALFLFGLRRELGRPLVVVTSTEDAAEALVEDLNFFVQKTPHAGGADKEPEIRLFPAWRVLPFEADSPDSRTIGERMRFLYGLISGTPGIFVAPVPSLMQKLPPWGLFADSVRTISLKSQIDPDSLVSSLVSIGYESSSLVTRVGEFSRRGGIIDFFSPLHEQPVRMEFFGDTLESLREFDPETQRSISEIKEAVVLPVRELIVSDAGRERFERRAGNEVLIDQVREGTLPPGAEFLAPFFYDMESLFQYLPENSLVAVIEPDDVTREIEAQGRKIEAGREEETEEGRILPEAAELYLDQEGVDAEFARFPALHVRLLGTRGRRASHGHEVRFLALRSPYQADRWKRAGERARARRRNHGGPRGETKTAERLQQRHDRLRH